ncbi:hypothetical protein ACFLWI_05970 [Chloroflexota bacterium]
MRLGYDEYLSRANHLEATKKHKLPESMVQNVAKTLHLNQINDLYTVNQVLEAVFASTLPKDEQPIVDLRPEDLLYGEAMIEQIAPFVGELREEIFGAREPPFKTRDEALDWLRGKAHGTGGEYEKVMSEVGGVFNEVLEDIEVIEFAGFVFACVPGMMAAHLLRRSELLGEIARLNYGSIVTHVLMGTQPVFQRYKYQHTRHQVKVLSSDVAYDKWVSKLTLWEPLSYKDMLSINELIRKSPWYKKTKQLKNKHVELYQMVKTSGGPPRRGVVDFWIKIMHEWNNMHPEDRSYTSWKGVKLAYDRLVSKLRGRIELMER